MEKASPQDTTESSVNVVGQTKDLMGMAGPQDTTEEGYPFLASILNMIVTPDSKKVPPLLRRCLGPELEEGEIPKAKIEQEGLKVEASINEKKGHNSTPPVIMQLIPNSVGSCRRSIWSTGVGASPTTGIGLDLTSSSSATRSTGDITTLSHGSHSALSSPTDKEKGEWQEPKRKTRGNNKADVGNDPKLGIPSERTLRTKAMAKEIASGRQLTLETTQ